MAEFVKMTQEELIRVTKLDCSINGYVPLIFEAKLESNIRSNQAFGTCSLIFYRDTRIMEKIQETFLINSENYRKVLEEEKKGIWISIAKISFLFETIYLCNCEFFDENSKVGKFYFGSFTNKKLDTLLLDILNVVHGIPVKIFTSSAEAVNSKANWIRI